VHRREARALRSRLRDGVWFSFQMNQRRLLWNTGLMGDKYSFQWSTQIRVVTQDRERRTVRRMHVVAALYDLDAVKIFFEAWKY